MKNSTTYQIKAIHVHELSSKPHAPGIVSRSSLPRTQLHIFADKFQRSMNGSWKVVCIGMPG